MTLDHADIAVIGSGMGGATLAAALAPTGKRIVVLERGERLADCPEARDEQAIFVDGYFRPDETWRTPAGEAFNPGNYYCVGGNSKLYGAVLLRYRKQDFEPIRHLGGETAGWPISYEDLEPWYSAAEALYQVRGDATEDPTEPVHSAPYPHPPVLDEPSIAALRKRLEGAGVTPSSLPLGVDLSKWLERAPTPWDAFPDTTGGKMDAESVGISAALKHSNVSLETSAKVTRLVAGADGRIASIQYEREDKTCSLTADIVVLSAGAVNSAVLLLRSANDDFPNGLSNRSDQVGRNFMNHNCTAALAIDPFRLNDAIYQKTIQFNDFYLAGGPRGAPLGNVQLLGKVSGAILSAASSLPRPIANWIARHSVDFYVMSEDLPNPDSRVTVKGDQIFLDWKRSNWRTHEALTAKAKQVLRKAGFPIVLTRPFDRRTPNFFIVDASFLPTSAAVNPALTIAAQALRVGDHIMTTELKQ
jgi:choline dehydrogenase-like flavoprotein